MRTEHDERSTTFSVVKGKDRLRCEGARLVDERVVPADRREQIELRAVADKYESKGTYGSSTRGSAQEDVRLRFRSRRVHVRALGLVVLVIAVLAFASVFSENRILEGTRVAATAAAVPVALLLGLRRA